MKKLLFLLFPLWVSAQRVNYVVTQIDTSGTDQRVRQFTAANDYFDHNQAVNYPNPAITTQHSTSYYFRITAHEILVNGFGGFDTHMNRAIDRGAKVGFRLMIVDDSYGGQTVSGHIMAYPLSWHNSMQGEANPDFQIGTVWWPNYNSPSLQANIALCEKLVDDHLRATFRNGYRYKDCIEFRDIDFIGTYGEGHTFVNGAGGTWVFPTGTFWTLASLQFIVNTQKTYVRNVPMMGNVNFFASNSRLPSGFGSWFAQDANAWGLYGLRLDNYGNKSIFDFEFTNNATVENGINFKNIMSTRYANAPFLAEPIQFGFEGAGMVNYYHIKTETDLLRLTMCENADNIMNRQNPVQTDVQDIFRAMFKRMGYRLSINGGSSDDSLRIGAVFNPQLNLINTGIAPPYEDYNLIYYWKQAGVIKWQFNSVFTPKLFQPGVRALSDNVTVPAGLSGTGQLYIKLVPVADSMGKRLRKPMPMQINTVNGVSSQQSDTSYLLRNISVAVAGIIPPPPPPPPPNNPPVILPGSSQVDTLPKNRDTLNVAVSDPDGDALTLLWTRTSGPNTPTLAGTTTTTLDVSGMIAGNYQFRFTANDGHGGIAIADLNILVVDSIPIIVPPPPPPPIYTAPDIFIDTVGTRIRLPKDSVLLHAHTIHHSTDTTIASMQWILLNKNAVNLGTIVTPTDSTTRLRSLSEGYYLYKFTVTDNAGNSTDAYVYVYVDPLVIVDPPPPPPVPRPRIWLGYKVF